MKFRQSKDVRIVIPKAAIQTVFDECDRYERDETGGRVIGVYDVQNGVTSLRVTGIIEPGPSAERTPVYLMQDGEYQEQVFRRIETQHPDVEHLGNWHTHHVNGLPHLSDGDLETYGRIVNHRNHNTDFFYALLVVERNRSGTTETRYSTKHYLFRRGDSVVYEVPSKFVEVVDETLMWPTVEKAPSRSSSPPKQRTDSAVSGGKKWSANQERVVDRDVLQELYADVRPYQSNELGFYWRGAVELVDGTKLEVVVLENERGASEGKYSVMLRSAPSVLSHMADTLVSQQFSSARAALVEAERQCNRTLFEKLKGAS
ncbi:MAG: hypothetical protein IH991_01235 [Planctomycetes bacterium]|nr:hypothetical protein [Planctomycetota bacterium]